MTMLNTLRETSLALVVLSCSLLGACGGGGTADMPAVLQESELYNPITHPAGVAEQPGQTAVLGLQANVSDLPPLPSVPNKGVEDLWFEVNEAQTLQFTLDADTPAPVDRVEIRDAGNTLRGTLSATTPATTLVLDKGRYQALVYASAAATAPVPVFVQYGAATGAAQGAQLPGKEQAQYTINVNNNNRIANMYFVFQCAQCNLQGHSLSAWHVVGRDFHSTTFNHANLHSTQFDLANLKNTNFSSATLSNASFKGADLTGANFTGADLSGTQFTNADLSSAIWVDGVKRCAPGSIGVCR